MATVIQIAYILHKGFIKYVPKSRIKGYEKGFATRKRFDTKFIVNFFPKYVDFDKWVNKLKESYDEYLFDYWLYDIPVQGVVGTSNLWTYRNQLKKDFKIKKNKPKKTKKPKQTSLNLKDRNDISEGFLCGPGGCVAVKFDSNSESETENKKNTSSKPSIGEQISLEFRKGIKNDPDYTKNAKSIFDDKRKKDEKISD